MQKIQDIVDAINNRIDVSDKTKKIYISKFKKIIKGCDDTNFVDKFNDTNFIKNTYLKELSFRTKLTYLGEIFAVNFSYPILTKTNFDKLEKYRNAIRDENDEIMQTPEYAKKSLVYPEPVIEEAEKEKTTIKEVSSDNVVIDDTSSEDSESDYGHYCMDERDEVVDTLQVKKIALRYELERLQARIHKINVTLEMLDEI